MAWRGWSGTEVGKFVAKFCDLPEYTAALSQIPGDTLQQLLEANMLRKGLARAGVRDADHQSRICKAVLQLESWSPEELAAWAKDPSPRHFRAPPPKKRPGRRPYLRAAHVALGASLAPRKQSLTEASLQRSSQVSGHEANGSQGRRTPRLYDKSQILEERLKEELEQLHLLNPPALDLDVQLRSRVARSVLEYEAMRDSDSPPPGIVTGLRGLQQLKEEEEGAATRIQAKFRQKKANEEVQKLQQQREEESQAATKIQAKYRGKKAGKDLQEMREQKAAAVSIQTKYRQRAAQKEVQIRRQEVEETVAATKIQSKFRQKQAASEAQALRTEVEAQSREERRKEFCRKYVVKINIRMNAATSQASVDMSVEEKHAEDEEATADIEDNEETTQAATKIQARFRQKQAASEVEALRKAKEGGAAEAEGIDIEESEETAQAATKIQARFRQKQAASEVEALRKAKEGGAAEAEGIDIEESEETAQAATKIQARFRQKQAASEVEALRKAKETEAKDAGRDPAVEQVTVADAGASAEYSEVEAMLLEKERQQQQLVEDRSPKAPVETMAPSFEKRPVSVSPAIPEGDEEE